MPHSPRLHDGRLWLLNSGAGEFGCVDRDARRFVPVAFCPGYARGLAFVGGYRRHRPVAAAREPHLPGPAARRGARRKRRRAALRAAWWSTPRAATPSHWLRFEGVVRELYDVAVLPGVRNPAAIGFVTDEIQRVISIDET